MPLNFPNSPGIGSVYTDATSGFSYEWDGTLWKSYSAASSSNIKILDDISGSFNGSTQTFTLTSGGISFVPASAQSLIITLGGVTQKPVTDYTVSTTNITFTDAPQATLSFSGISLGPAVPLPYANDGNIYIRNTYTGAGTTGPFSFPEGYTVGYLDVYRNGVRLRSGSDFVGTSGTNFFLTDAAAVNDEIEAIGYKVSSLVQANSNLDNLNVTGITTTGRLQVTTNANIVGIVTASSFVGNLTGTASTASFATTSFGLSGSPNITIGNLTGVAATFTGNVSIAGTLTYEDVTNVDSVGLVTARTGVKVTAGGVDITAGGLNVTAGVSTFAGITTVTGETLFAKQLNVSGVVTATDFNSLSDVNYKENISTVPDALSKVEQLRGVKFDWKESGLPSYGVIAQELKEILPELVHGDDPKTVNYNGIIGVLIEAIKELKAEIEEFKKKDS